MVRSGRQTVSVNVDAGLLLFDKKVGSLGTESVSHDRGTPEVHSLGFNNKNIMTRLQMAHLLRSSPSDRQVPEQPCQSAHGGGQQSQRAVGDDV